MEYRIAKRIDNILKNDKMPDPQHICEVLQDELKPLIESYIELNSDLKVRFKKDKSKNIFFIEFSAERIKPYGYIPF